MKIIGDFKSPWVGLMWKCSCCKCIFKTETEADGEYYTTRHNFRHWSVTCPKCFAKKKDWNIEPTSEECVKNGHSFGKNIFRFEKWEGTCKCGYSYYMPDFD